MKEPGGVVLVGEDLMEQVTHLVPECGVELDGGVVLDHGVFDLVDFPVGSGAGLVSAASAEEVPVGAAASVGSLDDQSVLAAVSAPERALEVVVVLALAFARGGAGVEDLLHPFEDLGMSDVTLAVTAARTATN